MQAAQQPTILVVEDEPAIRLNLVETLREEGFSCVEADSIAGALKLIFELPRIDLIISDLKLGNTGEGGFILLDRIKRETQTEDIPVIFLTAYAEKELIVRAMKAGAADYLTKPYTSAELLGAIAAQLGGVKRKSNKRKNQIDYYIILNSPTHQEERIPLKPNHTIGRSSSATTTVSDDEHVSRIGVTLQRMTRSNPVHTVAVDGRIAGQGQNVKSANGVLVNGERIIGTRPLKNGDRVDLSAKTWFEYRVELPSIEGEDEKSTAI